MCLLRGFTLLYIRYIFILGLLSSMNFECFHNYSCNVSVECICLCREIRIYVNHSSLFCHNTSGIFLITLIISGMFKTNMIVVRRYFTASMCTTLAEVRSCGRSFLLLFVCQSLPKHEICFLNVWEKADCDHWCWGFVRCLNIDASSIEMRATSVLSSYDDITHDCH